jgi:catechol 2,3-dioxygenase-like lactoylglutathione lyase family enzyme
MARNPSTRPGPRIHHLTLRVTDVEVSARFYERALGVTVDVFEDRSRFRVGGTVVVLRPPLPGTPPGDEFTERRIGLDHMAFHVRSESELEVLLRRLRDLGVDVGTIERDAATGGIGLAFRDPDNIQLEFYVP